MSHDIDNDVDLLEEIKYDRNHSNNSSSSNSLVSLFENDKSAVFTPSAFTTVLGSLLCAIVIGTLWWQGVNTKIDTFENIQQELAVQVGQISDYQKNEITSLYSRISALHDRVRDLNNAYDSDAKIFQSSVARDILNLTSSMNDLTKDTNDLHKKTNEMEKNMREIEFSIERLNDQLQLSQRPQTHK